MRALAVGVVAALGFAGAARSLSVAPLEPGPLAVGRDGALYIADERRGEILRRAPEGRFSVIASKLRGPGGMAVAADGSLYVADTGNNRVRRISPAGRITTVASVCSPTAVTFDARRRLVIASSCNEVLRLEPGGTLTRLAGNRHYAGIYGVGGPAVKASPDGPSALAYDARGNLFLAGFDTKSLLMIDAGGRMRELGPRFAFYPRTSGGIVAAAGRVYAVNTQQLDTVSPAGVRRLFDFAGRTFGGIKNVLPNGLAVAPDGTVYVDTGYGNGWSNGSAILSVRAGHARVLWVRKG